MFESEPIVFGSVCSGIEAASLAWEPLGMQGAWFSEIESFPSAVLAHHWPQTPNLGDMTAIAEKIGKTVLAPEVLVGGTPCQAFSIAGLREGLNDPRGALTIKYIELANKIDEVRAENGEEPCVIAWENVPGVLSDKENAFGCFLGGLAGEDCELVPPGKKWGNAGCVFGPKRTVAWRVLDAQYFGVAQRRRRVFVVASAREGFDPTEILFELEGLRRDSAPSREKAQAVTALTACGVGTCGADDNQGQAGHLIVMAHGQGGAEIRDDNLCPTLTCNHEAPIAVYSVHGTQDPDTLTDLAHTLGRNQGQENAIMTPDGGAEGAQMAVRRLLTEECEVLQGMPPGHTLIPRYYQLENGTVLSEKPLGVKAKLKKVVDSHRYKAVGNSMAVPVMRWIGRRIATKIRALNSLQVAA